MSVGQKLGFVWGCFDQPSCECAVETAEPSTTAKAVALGCASNRAKRSVTHIRSHCARTLGEYGVTDTHKTVKHQPKVILSVT